MTNFFNQSYRSLLERLFSTIFFGGMKLGLNNALRMSEALGSPEKSFKSILVAGTNGKGSVALKMAKALEASGFRTGLYTSPHISCFRERIKINGVMIAESDVEEQLSKIFEITERFSIPATFFELTTTMALCYFAQQGVDFAVLEVGMGGRLDATNIVMPVLSVITSIDYDHTAHLGDTLELIAQEKGGIIRPFIPVILGPGASLPVLSQMAFEKESPCIQVGRPMSAFYDHENTSIAKAAMVELSKRYVLKEEAIETGLSVRPLCRFQVLTGMNAPPQMGKFPEAVVLDVAHNPNGLERLFEAVLFHYPNHQIRVIAGLSGDKDLKKCLAVIAHYALQVHLVCAKNPRAASIQLLQQVFSELGVNHAIPHATIENAVEQGLRMAAEHGEVLVVCGSFFIMSEVRRALGILEPCDPLELNENLRVSSSSTL